MRIACMARFLNLTQRRRGIESVARFRSAAFPAAMPKLSFRRLLKLGRPWSFSFLREVHPSMRQFRRRLHRIGLKPNRSYLEEDICKLQSYPLSALTGK